MLLQDMVNDVLLINLGIYFKDNKLFQLQILFSRT